MMSNKIKRILAVVMAMVMVFGMSITTYAATGEETGAGAGTGEGTFEGSVDKDVISVTLPTSTETTFAFLLDPEGLIAATGKAKYENASFEEGANVFFQSAANTYTKESAALKVINKGTVAVDVTVSANAVGNVLDRNAADITGINKVAENSTVANNVIMADDVAQVSANDVDLPILYLGLQVANQDAVAVRTASANSTASVAVGVSGNDSNFEVTYDAETGEYAYAVKEGVADTAWNSFEFNLVGECNVNGDWSATDLEAPNVQLTWKFDVREDGSSAPMLAANAETNVVGPRFAATNTTSASFTLVRGQDLVIQLNTGDEGYKQNANGATFSFDSDPDTFAPASTTLYTYSSATGTFTFKAAAVDKFLEQGGGTLKFSFDGGAVLTAKID